MIYDFGFGVSAEVYETPAGREAIVINSEEEASLIYN